MNENITLSLADIESYRGQGHGAGSGHYQRYYCPIHGGDHQRSLKLNPETGHFKCYTCGAWGYLSDKREEWAEDQKRRNQPLPQRRYVAPPKPEEPKPRSDLLDTLKGMQEALPGSWGEKYLELRGIPLEVAQRYGIGYSAAGKWPNPKRDWKYGRLVVPHQNSGGELVNLYGRAVGAHDKVPKEIRHDHLPGLKGVFNAPALLEDTVIICEGAFDALSLLTAGYNACAVYGVDGLRWHWVKSKRVVFAFDADTAGQKWKEHAWDGVLLGKQVYFLPPEAYRGHKDINELWVADKALNIEEWVSPSWDENEALKMIEDANEPISASFPEGFYEWLTTSGYEERYNQAQGVIDGEFAARSITGLTRALDAWKDLHRELFDLYGSVTKK